MSNEAGLSALVAEIKAASANISDGDARTNQRIDGIERSVNELYRNAHRPGAGGWETKDDAERNDARELCVLKHDLDIPKNEGNRPAYEPSSGEVDAALIHRKALGNLFRHGNVERLDQLEKKN